MKPSSQGTFPTPRTVWIIVALLVLAVTAGILTWALQGSRGTAVTESTPTSHLMHQNTEPAGAASSAASPPVASEAADGTDPLARLADGDPLAESTAEFQGLAAAVETTAEVMSSVPASSADSAEEQSISPPAELSAHTEQLRRVLTGAALAEAEAQYGEFAAQGWHLHGTPQIVGTPKASPLRWQNQDGLLIAACIDSSRVQLLDAQGHPVGPDQNGHQALNLYTVVQQGSVWKIAEHTLPAETACP